MNVTWKLKMYYLARRFAPTFVVAPCSTGYRVSQKGTQATISSEAPFLTRCVCSAAFHIPYVVTRPRLSAFHSLWSGVEEDE